MAGFRKAKAEQAALKLGLYGPPGSGKTMTALLLAEGLATLSTKRVAYIETICRPLLGLLGAVQAQMTTTDEAAGIDAEQIEREEQARTAESAKLLREFSAKIDLCVKLTDLKAVGKTITPQVKAQMLTADVAALREKYGAAEDRIPKIEQIPTIADVRKLLDSGDEDGARDLARSFPEAERIAIENEIKARHKKEAA